MNDIWKNPLTFALVSLALVLQATLVAVWGITAESLWIDEFDTAKIADSATLATWWEQFRTWGDADTQMPLYHFYMFIWAKLFGFSEYALRMANLPWLILAGAALLWTFRATPVFAVPLIMLSTFHPFLWYYLNEARPYLMVFAGASWTMCALINLYTHVQQLEVPMGQYSAWLLTLGMLTLAGSSMIGAPWAALAAGVALYLHMRDPREGWRSVAPHGLAYGVLGLGLLLLALYYIYTLAMGTRSTAPFETDLKTLLFAGYELLGLSGLGPGRLQLRAEGVAALEGWLVFLCLGTIIILAGLAYGLRALLYIVGSRKILLLLAITCLPVLFIAGAGFMMHWRVLGRHFMPALPVIVCLLALGMSSLLHTGRRWGVVSVAILTTTIVVSGVSMQFPRHAKDDYRSVAELSLQALESGQTVWWGADLLGAWYYGLPITRTTPLDTGCGPNGGPSGRLAIHVSSVSYACLAALPAPQIVVLSKPDLFDREGALERWVDEFRFRREQEFPAFAIWRAPENEPLPTGDIALP